MEYIFVGHAFVYCMDFFTVVMLTSCRVTKFASAIWVVFTLLAFQSEKPAELISSLKCRTITLLLTYVLLIMTASAQWTFTDDVTDGEIWNTCLDWNVPRNVYFGFVVHDTIFQLTWDTVLVVSKLAEYLSCLNLHQILYVILIASPFALETDAVWLLDQDLCQGLLGENKLDQLETPTEWSLFVFRHFGQFLYHSKDHLV